MFLDVQDFFGNLSGVLLPISCMVFTHYNSVYCFVLMVQCAFLFRYLF